MDENTNFLEQQARELIVDPQDEKPLAAMISSVFSQQEEDASKSLAAMISSQQEEDASKPTMDSFQCLFKYCMNNHPNHLALKLSKILHSPSSSETPSVMAIAIFLIYSLLLNDLFLDFSAETLSELKHTVLITLQHQISTSGFPVLSAVISLVAYHVFFAEEWTDYLDYVDSLIDQPSYTKKGLWLVLELPLTTPSEMIVPYFSKIEDKIFSYLDSQQKDDKDGDISAVAFASSFSLMVILAEMDICRNFFDRLKNSITGLMNKGKQVVLQKGLKILCFYGCKKLWLMNKWPLQFVCKITTHIKLTEGVKQETLAVIKGVVRQMVVASNTLMSHPKFYQLSTSLDARLSRLQNKKTLSQTTSKHK